MKKCYVGTKLKFSFCKRGVAMYDIAIIGAGVSGSSVAREISRYKVKACVLEACEDVNCGTSKANSGIVHAGFDAATGSLMAKLNVEGNSLMWDLVRELDIPATQNGSLVICNHEEDLPKLRELYDRGIANGVKQLKILSHDEVLALEPNITDSVVAALYAPTGGIVDPFILNIAMAENACDNGVEFYFNSRVKAIEKKENSFLLHTDSGDYEAKYVVNAAGVYADEIHNMVSEEKIKIIARRGDYCLLDNECGGHVKCTIFALPGKFGKGVLVSPTAHGNLLVGPTAIDIKDKEGTNTTSEGLDSVVSKAGMNVKNLPMRKVITSFSGLRAHWEHHEFIIGEVKDAKGFIDCAGIESPGLTASPAIGKMVAQILKEKMSLAENPNFNPKRQGIPYFKGMTDEEKAKLIEKDASYGRIVCRCEMVTEGQVLNSIRRTLGATTLDGVKKRTRAGMGRCQAGFCTERTMELLAQELNIPLSEVCKSGKKSKLITGVIKDSFGGETDEKL